jgi:MraZ protein
MSNFLGEYECRLDAKGRLIIPSALKKQLSPDAQERFVINRGFEKHLNLYPLNEWKSIAARIGQLNLFVKRHRDFVRKFNNGASELEMDAANRILISKGLLDYAGIEKDVVLFAYANRIEVWSKTEYDKVLNENEEAYSDLAEEVMGRTNSFNNTQHGADLS